MAYPTESRVVPPVPDAHRSDAEELEPGRERDPGAVDETDEDAEHQMLHDTGDPAGDRAERTPEEAERTPEEAVDEAERTPDQTADEAERTPDEAVDRAPDERPAEPAGSIWGDGGTRNFEDRLRDLQLRFVDDPRAAVDEARSLTAEVVDALTVSIGKQRDDLATGYAADAGDTEELRVVLRRYRQFVERVLQL